MADDNPFMWPTPNLLASDWCDTRDLTLRETKMLDTLSLKAETFKPFHGDHTSEVENLLRRGLIEMDEQHRIRLSQAGRVIVRIKKSVDG